MKQPTLTWTSATINSVQIYGIFIGLSGSIIVKECDHEAKQGSL